MVPKGFMAADFEAHCSRLGELRTEIARFALVLDPTLRPPLDPAPPPPPPIEAPGLAEQEVAAAVAARDDAKAAWSAQSGIYDWGWVSLACFSANLQRLVLGCIKAEFCNQNYQIHIFQHFARSTRFAYLRTAGNSKISYKLVIIFGI